MTGQPAASCPAMVGARRLPVRVQVAAWPDDGHLVLRLAREIELATEWHKAVEGLSDGLG